MGPGRLIQWPTKHYGTIFFHTVQKTALYLRFCKDMTYSVILLTQWMLCSASCSISQNDWWYCLFSRPTVCLSATKCNLNIRYDRITALP